MDYVNPVSIAQMAQVPKDTSLPGTGFGLMQGFNEGQAMNRAKDFLSLSQAAQAQDYVKQQFDMQSKWQDRPFELQKRQTELEGTQLGNQKAKWDIEQAHQSAKRDKMMDQLRVVASYTPLMDKATSPLERASLFDNMKRRIEGLGYTLDPELVYNPNDPSSWDNLRRHAAAADEITIYDKNYGQKIRTQGFEQDWRSKEGALDRKSKEQMNSEDNVTRLEVQRQEAAAKQIQAKLGSEGFAAIKGHYMREWARIEAIPPNKRTPEDKATAIVAEKVLAAQAYNMAPARVGERAETQTRGEMRGLDSGSKGNGNQGNTSVSPEGINIQALPEPKEIPSQSIEDKVNRYLQ